MNIKRELKIYADRIEDYDRMIRETSNEYLELAFAERKSYALPLPADCGYESWEEFCMSGDFDAVKDLVGFTNLWDHHGDYHEIYPTEVYREEGTAGLYINGYDLTWNEYRYGWYLDCNNDSDVISFIQAVLEREE